MAGLLAKKAPEARLGVAGALESISAMLMW